MAEREDTPRVYTVHGIHHRWIHYEDIPALLELVDSDEPCASVASSLSSVIVAEGSTVGKEALFLTEGYRKRRYPSTVYSTLFDLEPEAAREWWERQQRVKQIVRDSPENIESIEVIRAPPRPKRTLVEEACDKALFEATDSLLFQREEPSIALEKYRRTIPVCEDASPAFYGLASVVLKDPGLCRPVWDLMETLEESVTINHLRALTRFYYLCPEFGAFKEPLERLTRAQTTELYGAKSELLEAFVRETEYLDLYSWAEEEDLALESLVGATVFLCEDKDALEVAASTFDTRPKEVLSLVGMLLGRWGGIRLTYKDAETDKCLLKFVVELEQHLTMLEDVEVRQSARESLEAYRKGLGAEPEEADSN